MRKFFILLLFLFGSSLSAQSTILLSLETSSTSLQTGQYYDVNLRIDDATELWLATMQIRYDPAMIYIVGTKAGSPVQQGSLFNPNSSVSFYNRIEGGLLFYSISMLAPAEPVTGDGIAGTIRIYPLQAGQTQLTFNQAEMSHALFEMRDGQRVGVGAESLAFTAVLLELSITGETVEEPSEATATPLPTETPGIATQDFPTEVPTLVNVTAAPRTPEPNEPIAVSDDSLLLYLAIALVAVGGIGAGIIFWMMRRKK